MSNISKCFHELVKSKNQLNFVFKNVFVLVFKLKQLNFVKIKMTKTYKINI